MFCMINNISLPFLPEGGCFAIVQPLVNPAAALLFSPVRLIFLIVWVYLCMYSVRRVEFGSLVPPRYKAMACVLSLFIGPLLLFVLFVVDTTKKIEEGTLTFHDILTALFGDLFNWESIGRKRKHQIQLLDSAGRSFFDVYGGQSRDRGRSRKTLDLTEGIILNAIHERASDLLIDPKSEGLYLVRFRVDGFLRTINQIDEERCTAIVNSIKALSGMDIAEKRRPQDGSFMAKIPEGSVHFRVASSGVLGGEKLSIRILDQSSRMFGLEDVGLSEKTYAVISNAVKQSSGMVLVCGPTGSGKTTSLYAMLDTIDFNARNVVTIEDPIERILSSASQIEVNVKANITFANTLRSVLRQDPDVICVGEIRDGETAAMAMQASQTGHLVLATLHSSSNMATIVRLLELGVKPLLLASAVNVIMSQRLVRRLCDHCKSPARLSDEQIANFQKRKINYKDIMKANGCRKCRGSGYYGRTAVTDVLCLDDAVKADIANNELSPGDLKRKGDEQSRTTLRKEGLKKVLEGATTFEEIKRVTSNLG